MLERDKHFSLVCQNGDRQSKKKSFMTLTLPKRVLALLSLTWLQQNWIFVQLANERTNERTDEKKSAVITEILRRQIQSCPTSVVDVFRDSLVKMAIRRRKVGESCFGENEWKCCDENSSFFVRRVESVCPFWVSEKKIGREWRNKRFFKLTTVIDELS